MKDSLPKLSSRLIVAISFYLLFTSVCFAANTKPVCGTISPASGSSYPDQFVTFTTTYTDADGWQNIWLTYFLTNTSMAISKCCYATYDLTNNKIYLKSDDGLSSLGGFAPGSSNILENSYVKLDCSKVTVSGSGNTLTIKWSVIFKTAFQGNKNTYLRVMDRAGSSTDLIQKGSWTVSNHAPKAVSISPSTGVSQPLDVVDFLTTFSDQDGWQNINYLYFLVNTSSSSKVNCLYGYYNQNTNLIYLRDDADSAWLGGFSPGSANSIENSYVKLDCSQITVSGSGTTLTIKWAVIFKATFPKTKNAYLYVQDNIGSSSGWQKKGTWTISNQAPQVVSLAPSTGSSSSGQAVNFSTVLSDPDGWLSISNAYLLVSTSSGAKSNCFYGYYNKSTNLLYLRNDDNATWLGGFAPGSANIIENSYAKLDCSQVTVAKSGLTMTIGWNITFKTPFTGTKNTYLYVQDLGGLNSGWQAKGKWTIANNLPQIISLNPTSGVSATEQPTNFSTTFSDPDSYLNINYVYFLINTSTSGLNSFYGYYVQHTNKLYLRNDANNGWLGGFAPGSANIIENSYAKLDCSKTLVTGSGTNLAVNWSVSFKSNFTGTKNTYLYIKDDAGSYVGWVKKGTWAIQANRAPTISQVTPTDNSIFTEGDSIEVKVIAQDLDADALEYQFSVDGTIVKAWSSSNIYSWQTQMGSLKNRVIQAEVRDPYGALDSKMSNIFLLRNIPQPE